MIDCSATLLVLIMGSVIYGLAQNLMAKRMAFFFTWIEASYRPFCKGMCVFLYRMSAYLAAFGLTV